MKSDKSIAGIILAAGQSRRMGQSKQLLDFNGAKLAQWVVSAAENSNLSRLVVVLGHEYDRIAGEIRFNRSTIVIASRFQEGLSASIKTGLNAIDPGHDAAMFLLADQPWLTSDVIDRLITEYLHSNNQIIVPTYQGKRGNPVIIGKDYFPYLFQLRADTGGREIIARYPNAVSRVEFASTDISEDIDTVEQYQAALERKLSSPPLKVRHQKSFFSLLPVIEKPMIALVGGGGKTSLMFHLATEYREMGKNALVTTTTAIFHPDRDHYFFDQIKVGPDPGELSETTPGDPGITVLAKTYDSKTNKLYGFEPDAMEAIQKLGGFDCVITEADGAKHLPIKAPADYEPVIPKTTDIVIGVIGLDCIGKPITDDWVHRKEIFMELVGARHGDIIGPELVYRLIKAEDGLFKSTPEKATKILVLNKADTRTDIKTAIEISELIWKNREENGVDRILVSSFKGNETLFEIRFG